MTPSLPRGKEFFPIWYEMDAILLVSLFHLAATCIACEKDILVLQFQNTVFNAHFAQYLKGINFQIPEGERARRLYIPETDGFYPAIKLHDRVYNPHHPLEGDVHATVSLSRAECDAEAKLRIGKLAQRFGFPAKRIWSKHPQSLRSIVTEILDKMGAFPLEDENRAASF